MLDWLRSGPETEEDAEAEGSLEEMYFLNESKEHLISKANLGNNIQLYSLLIVAVVYQVLYGIGLVPGGYFSTLALLGALGASFLAQVWLENQAYKETDEVAEVHDWLVVTNGAVYQETIEVPPGGWKEVSNPQDVLKSVNTVSDTYKYLLANFKKLFVKGEEVITPTQKAISIARVEQDVDKLMQSEINDIQDIFYSPSFEDIQIKGKKVEKKNGKR